MSYSKIIDNLFSSESTYIIGTHISPDSDAIGSSVALCLALKSVGKKVKLFLEKELSGRFVKLVPESFEIIHSMVEEEYVFVGVDCATKKRLGEIYESLVESAETSFNIDHHTSNELWAKTNYVDSISPASACIIYQILQDLKIEITADMASLLYAGILDDTGFFRFSNTTPDCLRIAANLVELGAKPADICNIIHFEVPKRVVSLRAKALNTLSFYEGDQVAIIYITDEMLQSVDCTSDDAEGLVDVARSVEGVNLAFFIRQTEQTKWKVSSRSKLEKYDVNQLAGKFGGGGHKMAAGFTFVGSLDDCIGAITREAKLVLN